MVEMTETCPTRLNSIAPNMTVKIKAKTKTLRKYLGDISIRFPPSIKYNNIKCVDNYDGIRFLINIYYQIHQVLSKSVFGIFDNIEKFLLGYYTVSSGLFDFNF